MDQLWGSFYPCNRGAIVPSQIFSSRCSKPLRLSDCIVARRESNKADQTKWEYRVVPALSLLPMSDAWHGELIIKHSHSLDTLCASSFAHDFVQIWIDVTYQIRSKQTHNFQSKYKLSSPGRFGSIWSIVALNCNLRIIGLHPYSSSSLAGWPRTSHCNRVQLVWCHAGLTASQRSVHDIL